jgi:hypothetical protein
MNLHRKYNFFGGGEITVFILRRMLYSDVKIMTKLRTVHSWYYCTVKTHLYCCSASSQWYIIPPCDNIFHTICTKLPVCIQNTTDFGQHNCIIHCKYIFFPRVSTTCRYSEVRMWKIFVQLNILQSLTWIYIYVAETCSNKQIYTKCCEEGSLSSQFCKATNRFHFISPTKKFRLRTVAPRHMEVSGPLLHWGGVAL